jgi:hypothetical protein
VFVSAFRYHPKSILALRSNLGSITITFNLGSIRLPSQESNRKIQNIIIFLAGDKLLPTFSATFRSAVPSKKIDILFDKNMVMSNLPPVDKAYIIPKPLWPAPASPSPLNAFADIEVEQTFTLVIDNTRSPTVDFSNVTDVVLGLDYLSNIMS